MKLIKLVDENDEPLYVNPLNIDCVYASDNTTAVRFGDTIRYIKCPIEIMIKLINSELRDVQHSTN